MNEQTARVWDIIVKVGVCMLTTRLHRLQQRDQDDDRQHHFGHEALKAVANTEIAEAPPPPTAPTMAE